MPVSRVVIVPAAPLLLPAASPAQPSSIAEGVADLRRAVASAVASLPEEGTALLLDSGPESLVHDARSASLAGYGLPHVATDVTIDADLLSAVSARGQAPRVRSDRLDGDPAVLALLLAEARPQVRLAPITVPARASGAGLGDVAVGVRAATESVPGPVAVVAAGDLSAGLDVTSPGYAIGGAADWDAEVVAAVRSGATATLGLLGPDQASRVQARGWAPVTVALLLAASHGIPVTRLTYVAPRGVGQLVAH